MTTANARLLRSIGEICKAGARAASRWPFNTDRQQDAEILEAMAIEAYRQAEQELNVENPQ